MDDDVNPMTDGDGERRLSILGTIHTHPQDTAEPSDLDWQMREDGELVMGVCSIHKTSKRRFVSFAFYNRSQEHVQLTIAEAEAPAMSATGRVFVRAQRKSPPRQRH